MHAMRMKNRLSIGGIAAATGASIETIRQYERIGLLPLPARTEGGQRRYTPTHVRRLAFIRNARELGFTLDTIENLLDLANTRDRLSEEDVGTATEHLADVRVRRKRLHALEKALTHLISTGRRAKDCGIIDALGHPSP